jgi:ribose 5-phosphate isomerase B
MKIVIGSDHRGYEVKKRLLSLLQNLGHEVLDLGTHGTDSVDYPDIAFLAAAEVGE